MAMVIAEAAVNAFKTGKEMNWTITPFVRGNEKANTRHKYLLIYSNCNKKSNTHRLYDYYHRRVPERKTLKMLKGIILRDLE